MRAGAVTISHPGQRHRGEGLIDLEQVDIIQMQAGAGQGLPGCGDRFLQHDDRVASRIHA